MPARQLQPLAAEVADILRVLTAGGYLWPQPGEYHLTNTDGHLLGRIHQRTVNDLQQRGFVTKLGPDADHHFVITSTGRRAWDAGGY